jgi:hypothetical protein
MDTRQRRSLGVSREKVAAMMSVLNFRWLSKGWHVMDKKDCEPMALAFIMTLDEAGVPARHYRELYLRSVKVRATRFELGLKCEDFSADLMVACWPALQEEIRTGQNASGRSLSASAPTQCLRCYGTGMEQIYDTDGRRLGVRPGCAHEHVDESDPHLDGFEEALARAKAHHHEETALDICKRIRLELTHSYVTGATENDRTAALAALQKWNRVERYVRENGCE